MKMFDTVQCWWLLFNNFWSLVPKEEKLQHSFTTNLDTTKNKLNNINLFNSVILAKKKTQNKLKDGV